MQPHAKELHLCSAAMSAYAFQQAMMGGSADGRTRVDDRTESRGSEANQLANYPATRAAAACLLLACARDELECRSAGAGDSALHRASTLDLSQLAAANRVCHPPPGGRPKRCARGAAGNLTAKGAWSASISPE